MTQASKIADGASQTADAAGSGERDSISLLDREFRTLAMQLSRFKHHVTGDRIDRLALMILGTLSHCGPSRLTAVAERCGFDPSTASRQVADLEKAGLLVRTTDPDDRRAVLLETSGKGKQLLRRLEVGRRNRIERMVTGWSEQEIATFAHLLGRLNQASEKYYEQSALEFEQELNHD